MNKFGTIEINHNLPNEYTPGGVHSQARRGDPQIMFTKAEGAYVYDKDGNRYIDYLGALGPCVLGHNHPYVNQKVIEAIGRLDLFGYGTTDLEIKLAEKICQHLPSADQVLFCNSGSEATYHAIRLARAVTDKPKIIKFEGCYHGWHDYVAQNVGSPWDKIGNRNPTSAGILEEALNNTLVCTYNDLSHVEQTFLSNPNQIAALIIEPIAHNMGSIMPQPGFLEGLRKLCTEHGALLIFDEIITGFRHHLGGFQAICNGTPDLTTLAKAMANGFPIAALAGKKEYMSRFNTRPDGDVLFAGTYNGHAVGTSAAIATIEFMEQEPVHDHLFRLGEKMRSGIREILQVLGIEGYVAGFGSSWVTYFMNEEPKNYTDLQKNNAAFSVNYRRKLFEQKILKVPSPLRRHAISFSHTDQDVEQTLEVMETVLREIQKSG